MSNYTNMPGHFWAFHKARMGVNTDQLPPSEALPGLGDHFLVFHNGLGFYYICKRFAPDLKKRLFECIKPGCRVTARMGEGYGSPLLDCGKHSHACDLGYRDKCLLLHEIRQRFSMQDISASVVLRDALSSLNEDEFPPPKTFECVTVQEHSSPMLSEELDVDVDSSPITIKEEEDYPTSTLIKEEIHVVDDETDDQNKTDDDTDNQNNMDDDTDDQNNMDDNNRQALLDLGENIDPSTDSVAIIDPSESQTIIACGQDTHSLEYVNKFGIDAEWPNTNKSGYKKSLSFSQYLGQRRDAEGTVIVPRKKVAAGASNAPSGKLQLSLSGHCPKKGGQGMSRARVRGGLSGRCPRNSSQQNSTPLKQSETSLVESLRGKLKENLTASYPSKSSQKSFKPKGFKRNPSLEQLKDNPSDHCPSKSSQLSSTLTAEEEASLVKMITMLGFSVSRKQILTVTANWARHLQKNFVPSFCWINNFIKRHPSIAIRENAATDNHLLSKGKRQADKNRRGLYSKAHLIMAIESVKSGMTIRLASSMFGIPRSTLRDKIRGKKSKRILTLEEERSIVERVTSMLNLGFPVSTEQLIKIVTDQVKELNKADQFSKGRPNQRWLSHFLSRHPDLAEKISTPDKAEKELMELFCETL